MSNYSQILYEVADGIGTITLNRPKARNAQSRILIEEVDSAFERASKDTGVRVIVLKGAGDNFSGGHDLGSPEELADRELRPIGEGLRGRYTRSWDMNIDPTLRWRNVPKPTIAAIQGYCIFAGWMVASACDVIIAADDALFLPTNFQYFSVPWDISPRKAKAILFESRLVDADEAEALGFVSWVVPRSALDAEVAAYAGRVAENDPFQLRMIKLAINQAQEAQGFTSHIYGAHALHMLSSTGEADPGYALKKPGGKRRPMVQRAFENYELRKNRGAAE
ncbi:MAG: enoyl-CoA hydratase/isomerase family protein [Dehalococcoidia bacterium]|uniref:enoyl-CoA hydratase-related protein n=1 Tax=Candidatus Amarobacter glycogenicus TaxID=3140699 RepID=UPI0031360360|nr:enoyl-CoA hydratase/isomerase family protein [Dehalococcoidia bacterium]MBK7328390.1 enoyl-CoA hydratase/isomerase family protein [Dehalococcoidia bacterium]